MILNKHIKERVIAVSNYILKTNCTIRDASKIFKVSKSTIHKDIQDRLNYIDQKKYHEIKKIMQEHISQRHIKGGESTRQLFLKKRQLAL